MPPRPIIALIGAILASLAAAPAQQLFAMAGQHQIPTDLLAFAAVSGDIDGDGDIDLLVATAPDGFVVLRNRGDGTFDAGDRVASTSPGSTSFSLALGDLDGDGDLDVIAGSTYFALRYDNDGAGNFSIAPMREQLAQAPAQATALADIDGDGDLDVVLCSNYGNSLFRNDGGAFTDVTATQLPDIRATWRFALGDIDGDGDPDIVFSTGNGLVFAINSGAGFFVATTATQTTAATDFVPVLADLDGDGDLDLLLVGGSLAPQLLLNNGAGTFVPVAGRGLPAGSAANPLAATAGDIDGDGDLDVLFPDDYRCRVFANNGTATFAEVPAAQMPANLAHPASALLFDADGDGDLDALLWNQMTWQHAPVELLLNDGTGAFTNSRAPALPSSPWDAMGPAVLAVGDLDGDGDVDCVADNRGLRFLFNRGDATFVDATPNLPAPPPSLTAIAVGDLDGDGDADIVAAQFHGPLLLARNLGNGNFAFTAGPPAHVNDNLSCLALGDLDGDGDPDLVAGNHGQPRAYRNDGNATFTETTATAMPVAPFPFYPTGIALADLDGDGDLDLLLGHNPNVSLQGVPLCLWRNDGTGNFVDITATNLPASTAPTYSLSLGDIDGDGDLDIVIPTGPLSAPPFCRLLRNDGNGVFTEAAAANVPLLADAPLSLLFVDADGDGDLDLVGGGGIVPGTDRIGQDVLLLNDGTGHFVDVTATHMEPGGDSYLACADLDGDGDADLIGRGGIHLSLQRHLAMPQQLRVGQPCRIDAWSATSNATELALPMFSAGLARFPLPPLGTVGLDIAQAMPLPVIAISRVTGTGSIVVSVPPLPALAGLTLYTQALLLVQMRLTSALTNTIVR